MVLDIMVGKQVRNDTESRKVRLLFPGQALSRIFTFIILSFFAYLHIPWHLFQIRPTASFCHHGDSHNDTVTYPGEHVTWTPCGQLKTRALECTTLSVPIDQYNATNSGNKTFSIPLIRLRGRNATQNLITNPGGPGGSGVNFLRVFGEQLNTIVGEGFHILSFDPRGVGGSRPRADCYPDDSVSKEHALIHNGQQAGDASEIYAWASSMVRACAETQGKHGMYVNTPQTAADMNSILDAVGQKNMVYWGYSYGSLLGQTYASLFPERSARVIIDGVVNAFDWYEGLLNFHNLIDAENVFDGFFSECMKAGPKGCSLASMGKTTADLKANVLSLVADIEDQPLSVYINSTHNGILTIEKTLFSAIFIGLYSPSNWPSLADRLAKLLTGNATDFFLAYGFADPFASLFDSNSFVKMNDGLSGSDHWPHGRDALLNILRPYWNQSLFGQSQGRSYYLKQQWTIPRTHNFSMKRADLTSADEKREGIKKAHPLLILSTTYDPVCPLQSAQSANAAFEGSRIVELHGYGHCSLAMPSLCVMRRVREFLYNGTLPQGHTTCEVDAPYFPIVQEDNSKAFAYNQGEEEYEKGVYEAQSAMAKEIVWGI